MTIQIKALAMNTSTADRKIGTINTIMGASRAEVGPKVGQTGPFVQLPRRTGGMYHPAASPSHLQERRSARRPFLPIVRRQESVDGRLGRRPGAVRHRS